MGVFEVNGRETFIVAVAVLFLGKWLTQKVGYLRINNIPEPVTGGVIIALLAFLLHLTLDLDLSWDLSARDLLLVVFFTTIGLSSRLSTLRAGGRWLVIMLVLAVSYLFLQNLLGIALAWLMGYEPIAGMMVGSVSLSGGHGTAIAWAPVMEQEYAVPFALETGLGAATIGLVLGGVIGGPIAGWLIKRHQLSGGEDTELTVGFRHKERERINIDQMLITLLAIAVSMEIGYQIHEFLLAKDFNLPPFVPCLLVAIILTNLVPWLFPKLPWWPTGTRTLALVSDLSLGLFLAMSLMSLQLGALGQVAGPLMVAMSCQLALIVCWCIWVVFPRMGGNYDAAVIAAGYAGFALGATPTAMANMSAVSKQFGAAPRAFIIIPLIGAFFIDVSNAFVIRLLISVFGPGG